MRYLILSDLHGNWDALAAVLRRVRRKRFDATLVLGDLVGYGAAPNQVIEAIRRLSGPVWIVRGNHDKVVAGLESGETFNAAALAAAHWTANRLTAANRRFLRELPEGPLGIDERVAICHGSPLDEDQYLLSSLDALEIFTYFTGPQVVFFGHTHLPSILAHGPEGLEVALLTGASGVIRLRPGWRYLLNPGAVGQPRDRNPLAAYMIYEGDAGLVRWFRIPYPVERAQERIRRAGLPASLAARLAVGI
ncbi:MAG: phosphodiesterase [Acidobacteria bacterium ADurb.Bin051]|nr:metallophosphoesterase family protein [Acidobacteriota bacterium]OQC34967.1 MAG: phosphodiesterase [Acidobacteria bacterium ADurb.Bin051]